MNKKEDQFKIIKKKKRKVFLLQHRLKANMIKIKKKPLGKLTEAYFMKKYP